MCCSPLRCAVIVPMIGLVSGVGPGLSGAARAEQQTLHAVADVWVRESHPDTTYENDLLSVWSGSSSDGARRYALLEFDLTPLAGSRLQGATLQLYSMTGGSQATVPLKQRACVVGSGGTPLTSLTWNTYIQEKDTTKQVLEGLGKYDLPSVNSSPSLQNAFVNSVATAADVALLQSEIDGDGKLSLVLMTEEGADHRRDWGDGALQTSPARLIVTTTTTIEGCRLTQDPLPAATQGSQYSATLVSEGCSGPITLEITRCMLPPGLNLDLHTGALSGVPLYAGSFPLTARLLDGNGNLSEEADFELVVGAVYSGHADLDHDGDVDLVDLDQMALAFSGPRPATVACEPPAPPSDTVVLGATGDVWVRELVPDETYESDIVSVWSSVTFSPDLGYRRHGLVEFDVSSLAGKQLASVNLSMWVADVFSGTQYPIKQKAFRIDSGGTPLTALTWSSYLAEKDATRQPFETLGRYDEGAPAVVGTAGLYRDSAASLADMSAIAAEATGDGKLSLVFIADEDGTDYRGDWGDGTNAGGPGYTEHPARLEVLLGPPCRISTTALPDAVAGQVYAFQLAATPECSPSTRWRLADCELPAGVSLNQDTGQITGTPTWGGDYAFRIRLIDTGTSAVRDADLSLHVVGSEADLDGDGDVDRDDYAILAPTFTGPLQPGYDLCWRAYVQNCLDRLIEYGTDRYGAVHSPMLMSILDVHTLDSPENPLLLDDDLRTEGRPSHGRRSPGGSNFWMDQVTLGAMYRFSEVAGDPKYGQAADAYIAAAFQHAVNTTPGREGTLVWGSHSYYHAFTDAPGGDRYGNGSPVHEILITHPDWQRMYAINPAATRTEVDMIWNWHVHDKVNGQHNRHDDGSPGCDFAYSGGSFTLAFASMYAETGEQKYLDRALLVTNWHWNHRNVTTGLTPDAPSTGGRYDATHSFTSVTGPYASQLLRCYEITGETIFRDRAVAYIKAYDQYAWDPAAQTYYGMVRLDGTPITGGFGSSGYDLWAPAGHIDVWRSTMFSYEFAVEAAEAALYAYELSGPDATGRDAQLLQIALRWAGVIERALPPQTGRRWKAELEAALPLVLQTGGTYAENYGRAISFFVNLYHATADAKYLDLAKSLGREAVEKLYVNGLFRGHPAKDYYQANDGVGFLLHALMQLDALPAKWRLAF